LIDNRLLLTFDQLHQKCGPFCWLGTSDRSPRLGGFSRLEGATLTLKPVTDKLGPSYRYNPDGDLIFSVSKDQTICVWFAHNGERLGTYKGHQGAIWTVDVDPTSTVIATGSADNTIRLWEVKSGKLLKTWDFPTAIKRVEFNEDGTKLLGVTEKRMGHLGTIVVLEIKVDVEAEQSDEKLLTIVCDESKATVAGWSYLSKYIIAGHEDGSVSQYDGETGDLNFNLPVHELNMQITDLQWSTDRTYFITASKDKTAKVRLETKGQSCMTFTDTCTS
jgi:translation initiation factor 3 subunit I